MSQVLLNIGSDFEGLVQIKIHNTKLNYSLKAAFGKLTDIIVRPVFNTRKGVAYGQLDIFQKTIPWMLM